MPNTSVSDANGKIPAALKINRLGFWSQITQNFQKTRQQTLKFEFEIGIFP